MESINWVISLVERISKLWDWLNEPLFEVGDLSISFLGFFSTTVIVVLLVWGLLHD